MKKTLIAFTFAVFCLVVPVLMAKAVAQDAEPNSVNTAPKAESSIKIEVEGLSAEQEGRLRRAVDGLGDILGDRAKTELEVKLDDLSVAEKRRANRSLDNMFDGDEFDFQSSGIGLGETIVAITALILTLGLPVIILLMVLIYAQRKRRQMMELAGMYVKADQPLPPHVLAEFGSGMTPDKRLRSGLQLVLVGIAIIAVLGALGGEAATIGLIPVAIGLSRLIYWRYESKQPPKDDQQLIENFISDD